MSSKKTSYLLILSLVVITMLGVVIGVWFYVSQDKFSNEKTIVLNEQPQTEMEVSLSGLCPGMSISYEIHLKANEGDSFGLTMDFKKTDADSLAPFVDVEVKLGGETLDGAKLFEYLDGKQITFPTEFVGTSNIDIEIVYSMGIEVGDEAQNTTADFNIVLSAKR